MLRAQITRPTEGRTIGVVGDVYRFLATGEETDGQYAMWEAIVLPGGGPPPHVHSQEQEVFFVLDGEIAFQLDGQRVLASAGSFISVPQGTLHAFRNEGSTAAKMLITVTPAGLEKMLFEVGQPLEPGATTVAPPTPADIEKLMNAAPRYGVEIRLPPHSAAPE